MRLDQYLFRNGLLDSRSKAKEIILNGWVKVGSKVIRKPSFEIKNEKVEIKSRPRFVSRAGYKLERALDEFNIVVMEKICLDVGVSTGGFTDCLLQRGAKCVYAVDVGRDQLHRKLRDDPRVKLFEGVDIRNFKTEERFDFISIDVSFISLRLVLPIVRKFLIYEGDIVALIKPQFEAGKGGTKKGVLKDKGKIKMIIENVISFSKNCGFCFYGLTPSPIKGKSGNQEFLVWLKI